MSEAKIILQEPKTGVLIHSKEPKAACCLKQLLSLYVHVMLAKLTVPVVFCNSVVDTTVCSSLSFIIAFKVA